MSKLRTSRQLLKILQMLGAFLAGVVLSQIFSRTFCGLNELSAREQIDNESYLLLILVLTAPKNFEHRAQMRETWLTLRPRIDNRTEYQESIFVPKLKENLFLEDETVDHQKKQLETYQKLLTSSKIPNIKVPNLKIKHLFAIGTHGLDPNVLSELDAEQKVYSDLLLLDDLKDSYFNLTLKLVKSMQKLERTSPKFKYLLKCDDDTYVKLNLMSEALIHYDTKLKDMKKKLATNDKLQLYWGYFSGRSSIKTTGKWQEKDFNLCDHYLPYALGGGYVLSKGLVSYIAANGDSLNLYKSEDISVGTWLSPFRHIHRRHDVRFDTAYIPRDCKAHHFVLHKRTVKDMKMIFDGNDCYSEVSYKDRKQLVEYFYDWQKNPLRCCDNKA